MPVQLSIIILNYNTKQLTLDSIASVEKHYAQEVSDGTYEILVADNASTDDSVHAFRTYKKRSKIKSFHIIETGGNIGFAAGNNKAVPFAKGKYVLFLNPDTIVYPKTLRVLIDFMESHEDAGAVSCKLINKNGKFDFNSHRGFPTPWNAFCYFSGLQKRFPKSRLFAGYTQGWMDNNTTHEVDAISGAFLLVPRTVGAKIKWWDEEYFFYGEDLQFSYDVRKAGYKVYYMGEVESMHIGGAISGIKKETRHLSTESVIAKRKIQVARFEAMRIFYKKNYKTTYPEWLQFMIFRAIDVMESKTLAHLSIRK
jgi:GT2 family glycosyltransferase